MRKALFLLLALLILSSVILALGANKKATRNRATTYAASVGNLSNFIFESGTIANRYNQGFVDFEVLNWDPKPISSTGEDFDGRLSCPDRELELLSMPLLFR